MNDVIPGLVVALVTAIVVAGIFLWTAKAKRDRIEALRALGAERGWQYVHDNGALHHGHRIAGDGWAFEAVSRSSAAESAPGSSSWDHHSQWNALGEDPGRSTFILGSRLSNGMDPAAAPPWALARLFGDEISGWQALDPGERLAGKYMLFAPANGAAGKLMPARTEELLDLWPAGLRLVVRSSPARLSLQVAGKRLEKPEDVLRLIELGESLAEH
jgi:hypothetical protein